MRTNFARDRARYGDDGARPVRRPPRGRDRLRRAGQLHSLGPRVALPREPRARGALPGLRGARAFHRVPARQAALRRACRRHAGLHRRRGAGDAQRGLRFRLPQCRARAGRAAAAQMGPRGGYAGAGAAPASGCAVQSRCALQALRHRSVRAREAWRAARLPAARRRLCGARGRAPGAARFCH